jgi:hypothetical protein
VTDSKKPNRFAAVADKVNQMRSTAPDLPAPVPVLPTEAPATEAPAAEAPTMSRPPGKKSNPDHLEFAVYRRKSWGFRRKK